MPRSELVYRELKDNILTNVYRAGFQALEPQLAKMLAVSRTPVREALIRLEAEGLVKLTPRRGMQVIAYSKKDFLELHAMLAGIVKIGVQGIDQCSDLSSVANQLRAEIQLAKNNIDLDQVNTWLHAYEAILIALVGISGNSHYEKIVASLQTKLHRAYFSLASLLASRADECFDFSGIVELVETKQQEKISELLEKMFTEQSAKFDAVIEKYQIVPL